MDDFNKSQVRARLGKLLDARRHRFTYVNKQTGEFDDDFVLFLNGVAGCIYIPTLFYIAMYTLVITDEIAVQPLQVLGVLFISVSVSIIFDIFMGFLFDKLTVHNHTGWRSVFTIVGTLGFIVSCWYFFNSTVTAANSIGQFRWCFVGFGLFYSMANLTHFRNSANYTPSQEGRTQLFYNELIIQASFLALFCVTPIVVKAISGACNCTTACANPEAATCLTCYTGCDDYTDISSLRLISLIFTGIAGIANVFGTFFITVRTDFEGELVKSTFNSRILDVAQNHFLLKIWTVGFFESFLLFGFGVWVSYALAIDVVVSQTCLTNNVEGMFGGYICTKAFLLEIILGFLILLVVLTRIICHRTTLMLWLWTATPFFALGVGLIVLLTRHFGALEASLTGFFIILLYCGMSMTKLFYSDAIFYDEYQTGSPQPYFPSSIYLLGNKIGFLLSLAFFYTLFNSDYQDNSETLTQGTVMAFAIMLIVASGAIGLFKLWVHRYELHAFDKIHLAIERNANQAGNKDDISFYDPIGREEIRKPISGETPAQQKLMSVLRNMKRKDILLVLQKAKHVQIADEGKCWCWVFGIAFVLITFLTVFKWDYIVASYSAWWLLVGLVGMPILLLCFLYNYNVYAAATQLGSTTFMNVERSFVHKVVQSLDNKDDL